jgi:hypothetical protein
MMPLSGMPLSDNGGFLCRLLRATANAFHQGKLIRRPAGNRDAHHPVAADRCLAKVRNMIEAQEWNLFLKSISSSTMSA